MRSLKRQTGSGKTIFLVILLTLASAAGFYLVNSFKYHDLAVDSEVNIEKQRESILNHITSHSNKIMEMAQVPAMAAKQVTKMYTDVMKGRYGKDGSKAMFQMLTEQNPTLDQGIFKEIQREMAGGRDKIANYSDRMIELNKVYKQHLKRKWSGWWIAHEGYPDAEYVAADAKGNYDAFLNAYSAVVDETNRDEGIKLDF
jgi:hypothetical protein